MNYIPGDFWRIDDRCGGKFRASQTFRTWDGLYVCRDCFEIRHPQDFVRGRLDNQTVPNARPEPINTIIGPLQTTVSAAALAGSTTISVASSVRFLSPDKIGIFLDTGNVEPHTILSIPSQTSIQITAPLGGSISVGNMVIDYSAVSRADIG